MELGVYRESTMYFSWLKGLLNYSVSVQLKAVVKFLLIFLPTIQGVSFYEGGYLGIQVPPVDEGRVLAAGAEVVLDRCGVIASP